MSHCNHIQSMLSEYNDGNLTQKDKMLVAEHLASCDHCALEDAQLRRSLILLNHLAMPEPRLDLWQEFEPKMVEIEAERRLTPAGRLHLWWQHFVAHFAEGVVIYTHLVAHQTLTKMERYLIRDPFRMIE